MSDFPEGKILFRFTTNPEDDVTGVDDVAAEYLILERPRGDAGLIVYGRRSSGEWVGNWGGRHVIKRLLELLALVHQQHDEPCRFDHHGFCQEHGCDKPCLYAEIRKAIEP